MVLSTLVYVAIVIIVIIIIVLLLKFLFSAFFISPVKLEHDFLIPYLKQASLASSVS
jgi:uncharacterized membrane protein YvbJ